MAAHDRMIRVDFAERPAGILDIGAEAFGRKLIFQFLDARAISVAKEKADHAIGKHPIDEAIDDRFSLRLAAEVLEKILGIGHGSPSL